jgi:hypothetical protein
MLSILK